MDKVEYHIRRINGYYARLIHEKEEKIFCIRTVLQDTQELVTELKRITDEKST